MMRITSNMMMDTTLRNLEANEQQLETLQGQLSSGQRITKPADDPVGTAQAITLQQTLDQSNQYATNMQQASAWLNLTDSALTTVGQSLQRANELAVQAANGTMGTTDLNAIQSEVAQLQQQVLGIAQTKYGASYIFAGTRSNQPGYTAPSSAPGSYQGNAQPVQMEVAPGVSMTVSANAQATFNPIFDALNQLQAGLQTNNQGTIQASITSISNALDSLNLTQSEIGASSNRVQFLQQQQQSSSASLTSQLSTVKDVDMAQAITQFSELQTTYQASLKAAAQAIQPSLLDYLH